MPVSAEEIIQEVLHPFTDALQREGITLPVLAKKLKKELNAKITKAYQFEGQVIYSDPMVDWSTRQRARKDALAYLGVMITEKVDHSISGRITVDLEGRLREAIEKAHGPACPE
jgi:hypothetical protein